MFFYLSVSRNSYTALIPLLWESWVGNDGKKVQQHNYLRLVNYNYDKSQK